MALPSGITPKTVTVGIGTFFDGTIANGRATITAPVNVIHTPTGQPIYSSSMTKAIVNGAVSFDLCPTDAAGLNRVDWTYKLTLQIDGADTQPFPVYFPLPQAGPGTVDLDTLVSVPSSAGTPVSVAVPVLSGPNVWTGTQDFSGATLVGISGGSSTGGGLAGSARIRAMADTPAYAPTLMASPPTVTQTSTATALLTKTVASTVGRWSSNLNPTPTVAGTVEPRGGTAPNGAVYTQPRATMLAFDTDAESFDFIVKATSTLRFRIWVNEQAATTGFNAMPSATNAKAYLNVNFGAASVGTLRRIVLEIEDLTNPVSVYGLGIRPIRTLVYPGISSPRVLVVGDSYALGTGATFETYGYARTMGRLMGWSDIWTMAFGGTGLVQDSDPTWTGRYITHLAPDVIPANPDLVIIQGSINDDSNAATTGTALTTYVNTLRASLPKVPVAVFSPLYIGTPFAASLTTNTNLKAAAAALNLPYVDLMAPSPFSGNGNTGAPDGLGNADVYRSTDNVHPNNEGHQMLGRIAAGQLARLLGLPL